MRRNFVENLEDTNRRSPSSPLPLFRRSIRHCRRLDSDSIRPSTSPNLALLCKLDINFLGPPSSLAFLFCHARCLLSLSRLLVFRALLLLTSQINSFHPSLLSSNCRRNVHYRQTRASVIIISLLMSSSDLLPLLFATLFIS